VCAVVYAAVCLPPPSVLITPFLILVALVGCTVRTPLLSVSCSQAASCWQQGRCGSALNGGEQNACLGFASLASVLSTVPLPMLMLHSWIRTEHRFKFMKQDGKPPLTRQRGPPHHVHS